MQIKFFKQQISNEHNPVH